MSEQPAKVSLIQCEVEEFTRASLEFVSTETVTIQWGDRQISRPVTTFKLRDHASATLAFACRRFTRVRGQGSTLYIVLNVDGVRSAEDALRFYLDRTG